MNNGNALALLLAAMLIGLPHLAHAYVGPGLGAGAIGAVVGVIGAVLIALFSIVYYPIKRMMRRRRATAGTAAEGSSAKS
jgi:preprotein translocase subunit SecD